MSGPLTQPMDGLTKSVVASIRHLTYPQMSCLSATTARGLARRTRRRSTTRYTLMSPEPVGRRAPLDHRDQLGCKVHRGHPGPMDRPGPWDHRAKPGPHRAFQGQLGH